MKFLACIRHAFKILHHPTSRKSGSADTPNGAIWNEIQSRTSGSSSSSHKSDKQVVSAEELCPVDTNTTDGKHMEQKTLHDNTISEVGSGLGLTGVEDLGKSGSHQVQKELVRSFSTDGTKPPVDDHETPIVTVATKSGVLGNQIQVMSFELPTMLNNELRNIPVSGMQLDLELNITNVRNTLLNPKNLSKFKVKENKLGEAKMAMTANVRLDSKKTPTIPLQFTAVMNGKAEVSSKDLGSLKLEGLKMSEFHKYVSALAANLCSTALKTGFPVDKFGKIDRKALKKINAVEIERKHKPKTTKEDSPPRKRKDSEGQSVQPTNYEKLRRFIEKYDIRVPAHMRLLEQASKQQNLSETEAIPNAGESYHLLHLDNTIDTYKSDQKPSEAKSSPDPSAKTPGQTERKNQSFYLASKPKKPKQTREREPPDSRQPKKPNRKGSKEREPDPRQTKKPNRKHLAAKRNKAKASNQTKRLNDLLNQAAAAANATNRQEESLTGLDYERSETKHPASGGAISDQRASSSSHSNEQNQTARANSSAGLEATKGTSDQRESLSRDQQESLSGRANERSETRHPTASTGLPAAGAISDQRESSSSRSNEQNQTARANSSTGLAATKGTSDQRESLSRDQKESLSGRANERSETRHPTASTGLPAAGAISDQRESSPSLSNEQNETTRATSSTGLAATKGTSEQRESLSRDQQESLSGRANERSETRHPTASTGLQAAGAISDQRESSSSRSNEQNQTASANSSSGLAANKDTSDEGESLSRALKEALSGLANKQSETRHPTASTGLASVGAISDQRESSPSRSKEQNEPTRAASSTGLAATEGTSDQRESLPRSQNESLSGRANERSETRQPTATRDPTTATGLAAVGAISDQRESLSSRSKEQNEPTRAASSTGLAATKGTSDQRESLSRDQNKSMSGLANKQSETRQPTTTRDPTTATGLAAVGALSDQRESLSSRSKEQNEPTRAASSTELSATKGTSDQRESLSSRSNEQNETTRATSSTGLSATKGTSDQRESLSRDQNESMSGLANKQSETRQPTTTRDPTTATGLASVGAISDQRESLSSRSNEQNEPTRATSSTGLSATKGTSDQRESLSRDQNESMSGLANKQSETRQPTTTRDPTTATGLASVGAISDQRESLSSRSNEQNEPTRATSSTGLSATKGTSDQRGSLSRDQNESLSGFPNKPSETRQPTATRDPTTATGLAAVGAISDQRESLSSRSKEQNEPTRAASSTGLSATKGTSNQRESLSRDQNESLSGLANKQSETRQPTATRDPTTATGLAAVGAISDQRESLTSLSNKQNETARAIKPTRLASVGSTRKKRRTFSGHSNKPSKPKTDTSFAAPSTYSLKKREIFPDIPNVEVTTNVCALANIALKDRQKNLPGLAIERNNEYATYLAITFDPNKATGIPAGRISEYPKYENKKTRSISRDFANNFGLTMNPNIGADRIPTTSDQLDVNIYNTSVTDGGSRTSDAASSSTGLSYEPNTDLVSTGAIVNAPNHEPQNSMKPATNYLTSPTSLEDSTELAATHNIIYEVNDSERTEDRTDSRESSDTTFSSHMYEPNKSVDLRTALGIEDNNRN